METGTEIRVETPSSNSRSSGLTFFVQLETMFGPENGFATKTTDSPVPDQVNHRSVNYTEAPIFSALHPSDLRNFGTTNFPTYALSVLQKMLVR